MLFLTDLRQIMQLFTIAAKGCFMSLLFCPAKLHMHLHPKLSIKITAEERRGIYPNRIKKFSTHILPAYSAVNASGIQNMARNVKTDIHMQKEQ
ncbi:MAG: hypothetical protein Ta2A_21450 [Treponemataceae bacterium]|nr:MAG: hypothetical protein Ta2A_21450 [Treponemataceae bacterium]